MEKETNPRIGVGVMIFKDRKILLGKRKSIIFGNGEYSFPGGHLEYMESFEDCAKRETKEETGIQIKNVRFLFLGNLTMYAPRHYIQICLAADWKNGEPVVMEADKCEGWEWYDLDNLPSPIFPPSQNGIDAYKSGILYRDAK